MPSLHTLLRRQLKRCFGAADGATLTAGQEKAWNEFLQAVDAAYSEFDEDRMMLERSLELSSRELLQANTIMRAMLQNMCETQASIQKQNHVLMELAKSPVVPSGDLEAAFRQLTEASAEALAVERVSMWLHDASGTRLRCADLYERGQQRHTEGTELTAEHYPQYFQVLQTERTISVQDASEDERMSEFAEAYLRPLRITSVLDASVWSSGRLVGVIRHEHVGLARRWSADDERFATSIADLACIAMEAAARRQTEQQLAAKLREVELLNRVMMGREERILELKDELKRVKEHAEPAG